MHGRCCQQEPEAPRGRGLSFHLRGVFSGVLTPAQWVIAVRASRGVHDGIRDVASWPAPRRRICVSSKSSPGERHPGTIGWGEWRHQAEQANANVCARFKGDRGLQRAVLPWSTVQCSYGTSMGETCRRVEVEFFGL
ncbi:hypothetical protein VUR80DRAFT_10141 [Thermomyces stellatus]